jgi:hypothetical protein
MADGQNNIISDFRVGWRGGVSRRVGVVVAMRYHDRFGTQIGFRSDQYQKFMLRRGNSYMHIYEHD